MSVAVNRGRTGKKVGEIGHEHHRKFYALAGVVAVIVVLLVGGINRVAGAGLAGAVAAVLCIKIVAGFAQRRRLGGKEPGTGTERCAIAEERKAPGLSRSSKQGRANKTCEFDGIPRL